MNAWEIVSFFRNFPELSTEAKLSTPELLRYINLGYGELAKALAPLIGNELAQERNLGWFDSTEKVYKPADCIRLLNVQRETLPITSIFKNCAILDATKKNHIDKDPHYTASVAFPIAVEQQGEILIWPALPVLPDCLCIKIQYIQTPPPLIFDSVLVTAAADTLILSKTARLDDDAYNGHTTDIYAKSATFGWTLEKNFRISDYSGTTRTCTFSGPTGDDEFTADTEYFYALNPVIPYQHHGLIIGAAMKEMAKAGIIKLDYLKLDSELNGKIKLALELG
jgi:hypothetical protein